MPSLSLHRLSRPTLTILGVAALVLSGCSDPSPTPDTNTIASPQTVEVPEAPGAEPQEDTEIQWDQADRYTPISPALLNDEAARAGQDAPLPVLLPVDPDLLASAVITVGESWYTASMRTSELTVLFKGSAAGREVPGLGTNKEGDQPSSDDHVLTRTHGIVTLTFQEFGAAYSIDVECARPMEDSRCTADDYIIELAETAGVLGKSQ